MADEFVLEDLVVNIIGDPAPYVKALQEAKRATEEFYIKGGGNSKEYQESLNQEREIQRQLREDERARRILMDEGRRVTESVMTSQEKQTSQLALQLGNLKTLQEQGTISQDTYAKAVQKVNDEMAKIAPAVLSAGDAFGSLATQVGSAAAALGLISTFQGAVSNFMKVEAAGVLMSAAIEATGHNVEATKREFNAFAQQIGDTTNVTRVQTLELLRLATQYGLTGEAAQKAVRDAIGLATLSGRSVIGVMTQVARIETATPGEEKIGRLKMLLIPQLFGIKDNALAVKKATEYMEQGFTTAEALGKTLEAQLNRDRDEINKLNVEIGKFVGEGVKYLTLGLNEAAGWFRNMDADARQFIVTITSVGVGFVAVANLLPIVGTGLKAVSLAMLTLAANPLTLTLVGLASVAVIARQITEHYYEQSGELGRINERLKEQKQLNEAALDAYSGGDKFLLDKAAAIKDVDERKKFLQAEKEQAQKLEAQLKKDMEEKNKQMTGPLTSTGRFIGSFIPGPMAERAAKEKEILEQARKEWEAAGKSVESFQKELDKLSTEKVEDQVTSATTNIKKQIGDMGLDKDQIERKRLVGLGATDKMLIEFDAEVAKKNIRKVTQELDKQIEKIGMNTDAIKRQELARKGATEAELAAVDIRVAERESRQKNYEASKSLDDFIQKLVREQETLGMSTHERELYNIASFAGDEATRAWAEELLLLSEQIKHNDEVMKRGEHTTKQFMTPYEKYRESIEKLDEELSLGMISWNTYSKAVAHAAEELDKAGKKADHANSSFSAAASGSAEAATRLQHYLDGLNVNAKRVNPFAPQFGFRGEEPGPPAAIPPDVAAVINAFNNAADVIVGETQDVLNAYANAAGLITNEFTGSLDEWRDEIRDMLSDEAADRAEAKFIEKASMEDFLDTWADVLKEQEDAGTSDTDRVVEVLTKIADILTQGGGGGPTIIFEDAGLT